MKSLYDEAAGKCSDEVGIETFRMLHKTEQEHLERINGIYTELTKGKVDVDSCRFYDFDTADKKEILKRIFGELWLSARKSIFSWRPPKGRN